MTSKVICGDALRELERLANEGGALRRDFDRSALLLRRDHADGTAQIDHGEIL